MFERIVRVCASWDWVTPVITLVQNWLRRPSTGYFLPYGHSFSAWEIKRFLKGKGITVWGTMVIGDIITLRVREAQALYTEYWLHSLGVPFEGGLSHESAAKYKVSETDNIPSTKTKVAVASNGGVVGLLDQISRLVDKVASALPQDPN